ncbi:MAG: hypothetical protein KF916_01065 [Microbacteriaceae bacterium]|nr:hypothetical protein [Microbacteriaceae bacterium]
MKTKLQTWLIPALFFIGYGWYLWLALANLFGVLALAAWSGGSLNLYAWVVLISGVVAPLAVFIFATIVTRKKSALMTVLVFTLGLSILAVLWLDMVAIANLGATTTA